MPLTASPALLAPAALQPATRPLSETYGLYGLGIPNFAAPMTKINLASTTVTIKQTRDIAAGEKVFLAGGSRTTTVVSISTVTNDGGYSPTWELFGDGNAFQLTSAWLAVATAPVLLAAGTTWTVTLTGTTGKRNLAMFSVAGLADANADQSKTANGAGGTQPNSGATGATTQADEFVFALLGQTGPGTSVSSPTAGYQKLVEESQSPGASPLFTYGEWQTAHATGTFTSAPTTTDTPAYGIIVVTYKIQLPVVAEVTRLIQPFVVSQAMQTAAVM